MLAATPNRWAHSHEQAIAATEGDRDVAAPLSPRGEYVQPAEAAIDLPCAMRSP
jgi:hypothetical protein